MNKVKWIAPLVFVAMLSGGAISGCIATGPNGERTIESLEEMTDIEFAKWQLYVQLGIKIGANRLLADGITTEEELDITATVIETVRDQAVIPGGTNFLLPAMTEAGLTNDEVQLLLLIVEQELASRGALTWINPVTGVVAFSPRTKTLLTAVANSLRSAVLLDD